MFDEPERARSADFYASVGALGRRFMEIEIEVVGAASVECENAAKAIL